MCSSDLGQRQGGERPAAHPFRRKGVADDVGIYGVVQVAVDVAAAEGRSSRAGRLHIGGPLDGKAVSRDGFGHGGKTERFGRLAQNAPGFTVDQHPACVDGSDALSLRVKKLGKAEENGAPGRGRAGDQTQGIADKGAARDVIFIPSS